ncbi:putative ribonuclease H-like domain-containing protein [Tanacetum coccineum]
MVPRVVLMKSGLVSVNTARQVNAAHSKTTVNAARPMSYLFNTAHSTVKRPIHKNTTFKNSNINQRVNTIRNKNVNTTRPKAVVNAVKGNNVNAVKASACWVWKPKTKVLDHIQVSDGLVDAKAMDGLSILQNYEEIRIRGICCLEGNPKEGKSQGEKQCPVTILNTIDHLGKFDGKADEGFFVGYSLNSKAFRVFNSRTKIVEENLHIRFSENTPNVVGTQSNGFAGTKASDNAGQARKETEPVKDYILLPLWTADPPYS